MWDIERAKRAAKDEAESSGVDCYIYARHTGEFCITDTDAYWKDERAVGWYTPAGVWHDAPKGGRADGAPKDKHRVWMKWDSSFAPIEYAFDTLAELNAFLHGIQAMNDEMYGGDADFQQFDTLEDHDAEYPAEARITP